MKKIFYLSAMTVLILGCWFSAKLYWGILNPATLVALAAAVVLIAFSISPIIQRTSNIVWVSVGLFILVMWSLPASIVVKLFPVQEGDPLGTPMAFIQLAGISIALIIVALLFNASWKLYKIWLDSVTSENEGSASGSKHAGKAATAVMALGLLLLILTLYKFYWFMVWDNTGDGLGYLWLPIPILAVLSSTFMLLIVLPEKTKLAALLFLLLIPTMIAITTSTQRVDFRQLTEARAARVSLAIESYYARNKRYPDNLRALIPWHLLSIPGPVIIYGQEWCYDGGDNYYRLGYIDREHWSAPHFIGQIYQTKGQAPDLYGMCEGEAIALQKRHPNFPYEYWVEGD